ncbi:hypothetical protein B5807_07058 [Epicoccum nigrum]|uniref:Mis12 domain-containing protein n=1 Tax=Epicoccum nigrum TaxID=105696 RepID=A0A1Y2LY20_EPING|nr:hypothetical protein B5807_07058 [Epicoccum nigrum]
MANPQQQENMLLTEHFSWPPISLIDDIINAVNEVLYRCTDTFEQGISGAPPHLLGFADRYAAERRTPDKDDEGNDVYPDAALEMEEGVLKLETLMENAVDKNFDKLEIWTLRNVLCLPRGEAELARWVRLGHYAGVDVDKARGVEGELEGGSWSPEKLFALRRKLVETQKLHAALAGEASRNAAQIQQLKALLRPTDHGTKRESASPAKQDGRGDAGNAPASLAFLAHTPAAQALGVGAPSSKATASSSSSSSSPTANHPLATHASFTTSQLPHLRSLLATLRPHLAATALPPNTNTAKSSSSDGGVDPGHERRLYLESQSKRILERRGVDTKEGVEGAVEGGRVRAEEVRGLEGIVEALERGAKERGDGNGNVNADGKGEGEEQPEDMDTT